jgi:hypothetical protein
MNRHNEKGNRQQTQIQKHQTNRHARIGFTGFDRTKNSYQSAGIGTKI